MARRRIVAHHMHESEFAKADELMPGAVHTGRMSMGEIDEENIPELEAFGLFVQVLEEPAPPAAEELAPRPLTRGRVPSAAPRRPGRTTPNAVDVYVVGLAGPLVPSWREAIEAEGAEILECLGDGSYTMRLDLGNVPALQALPFVTRIRLYGAGDTIAPDHTTAVRRMRRPAELQRFELLLHRAQDLPVVQGVLEANGVTIISAGGRKIRFSAIPGSGVLQQISDLSEVAGVDEFVPPRFSNDRARSILGIDGDNPAPATTLTGRGQIVAIADSGLDVAHPDFAGRIVGIVARGRPGDPSDPHGHGTHVAGSVLGDGSASQGRIRGAAPEAGLFFQSIMDANGDLTGLDPDLASVFQEAYDAGARIHNNSWGAEAESAYRVSSREVDEFVFDHPDMLVVIAAGNNATGANPANVAPGFVDLRSMDAPATAKNALTVGATRTDRTDVSADTWADWWPTDFDTPPISTETIAGNPEAMAAFSGRGPCNEEIRMKPDVVAPGTFILSTRASTAPDESYWAPSHGAYAYMGGTSMATPLVAGCAALVREYYCDTTGHIPSAALLKATLVNGTRWLTGADAVADHALAPNFHQGFGIVHVPTTVPGAQGNDFRLEFDDEWQSGAHELTFTGDAWQFTFSATGNGPVRLCLAWTDPPGRGLQNTLHLLLEHSQSKTKWSGNPDRKAVLRGLDQGNNVQSIRIQDPPAGRYLAQVVAGNLLHAPQRYALVVAGALDTELAALQFGD